MSFDVVRVMTSAAVATSGTVSIPYPSGKDSGAYAAEGHKAIARGLMATLALNSTFSLTFGTSAITFMERSLADSSGLTCITRPLNSLPGMESTLNSNA